MTYIHGLHRRMIIREDRGFSYKAWVANPETCREHISVVYAVTGFRVFLEIR